MKLLYLIDDYDSVSQTFVRRETDGVVARGHDVRVFSLHPSRRRRRPHHLSPPALWRLIHGTLQLLTSARGRLLLQEAIHIAPTPRSAARQIYGLALAHALRPFAAQVDHVHAHFFGRCSDIAYYLHRLQGVSFSVSGHASEVLSPAEPKLLARNARAAHAVVGESDLISTTLARLAQDGAPVLTVRSGLPEEVLQSARARHGIDRPVRLVTVARLVPKKGHLDALEAVRLLHEHGEDVTWSIVGEGPLRTTLESRIGAYGLGDKVRLLGARPNSVVLHTLQESDVFLLPCVRLEDGQSDGLPAALIEAVALGVPAISTAVAAIPELVRHESTGLIVDQRAPAQICAAVRRLADNPTFYGRLSESGQRLGRKAYRLEDEVDRLVRLFRKVASGLAVRESAE